METNASDYALTTILFIVNKENKVYLVVFYSHIWQHYLESSAYPIDVVMNHKNLEYSFISKMLTQRQVW